MGNWIKRVVIALILIFTLFATIYLVLEGTWIAIIIAGAIVFCLLAPSMSEMENRPPSI